MALLRLARQGYRGMKVPLRNMLNWEAACVCSIPGQVLSTYLFSVISVAHYFRVVVKESAISRWDPHTLDELKCVCVLQRHVGILFQPKGISFGTKEEKSRWKAALGTRFGRKTYGFHFPFKSCQNLGSTQIHYNSPGMILWLYSMICSLYSSTVFWSEKWEWKWHKFRDCRKSRHHLWAESTLSSRHNTRSWNERSRKVIVKLIPPWRAKATSQMFLQEPSWDPWGTPGVCRACFGLLSQPGIQGNTFAGAFSLKTQQLWSVLAECKWTSKSCRPSFGLAPAAKVRLLGCHRAVVSLFLAEFSTLLIIFFSALTHTEHCTGSSQVMWQRSCKTFTCLHFRPVPTPKSLCQNGSLAASSWIQALTELWENSLNKRSTNEAAKSAGSRDLFNFINLRVDAISLAVIGMLILSLCYERGKYKIFISSQGSDELALHCTLLVIFRRHYL